MVYFKIFLNLQTKNGLKSGTNSAAYDSFSFYCACCATRKMTGQPRKE
jgi:hypothetical protein